MNKIEQGFSKTTEIIVVGAPTEEYNIRKFLNKFFDRWEFTEPDSRTNYYYVSADGEKHDIGEHLYNSLLNETLEGRLMKEEEQYGYEWGITGDLSYKNPELIKTSGRWSDKVEGKLWYKDDKITINGVTGTYFLVKSTTENQEELDEKHKEFAKSVIKRCRDLDLEIKYECKKLVSTKTEDEEVCEIT